MTTVADEDRPHVELSTEQLINHICAHVEKGDIAKDRAQNHFVSAGLYLKELKDRHNRSNTKTTWAEYVETNCKLSKTRADELIRIADGRTTIDETRKRSAESMRKTRAKRRTQRCVHSQEHSARDADQTWNSQGNTPQESRLHAFTRQANEAVRLARDNKMKEAEPSELTPEVIKLAAAAKNAWAAVESEFTKRKQTTKRNGNMSNQFKGGRRHD